MTAGWLLGVAMQVAAAAAGGARADGMNAAREGRPHEQVSPASQGTSQNSGWRERVEAGGQFSVLADSLPRRDVGELRAQAGIEATARLSGVVRARFDGFVEGLIAHREGRVADAGVRVRDAWMEIAGERAELRAGYGRIVWGRLDEIQPSDVINPINTARFLFDGRASARLPVAFISSRVFLSEKLSVQGVLVPRFRRGSFDELDEPTSPFNLQRDVILPAGTMLANEAVLRMKPRGVDALSGGARLSATAGRVDFSLSAYRGRDAFGTLSFEPLTPLIGPVPDLFVVGRLVERYPRFTMVAGDFETVRGEWAIRGEAAVFVEKKLQAPSGALVDGRVLDAGVGVDRRTGEYRVFASVIVRREWSDAAPALQRTDVSVVGSIERQFAREKYLARAFAVVNPADASAFVRGLFVSRLRDSVALELSAAAFAGTGDDTLSRFRTRDFVLARLRVYW